ncbi:hypothetical protein FCM35_KLT03010 [Carex littledalei]|uniref:Uncharacterized protein n=1 Tax=Carex littledalei TaxID=544730 RepID=A0A833VR31_9POAL|nr:hypothetical protein FCM35_KLT03010 [Carex littledalei]
MVKKEILVQVTLIVLMLSGSLTMCAARPLSEEKQSPVWGTVLEALPKGGNPTTSQPNPCSHSVPGAFCKHG